MLFTVVIMLFVVAVTAYLVGYDSSFKANQPVGELEASRADYLAAAAMQHALWQNGNNACGGNFTIPATALGQDSYTATATGGAATFTVSLPVDQDAFIRNDDAGKNSGADPRLHARFELGKIEQPLYRFELPVLFPGMQINSATAWFYLNNGNNQQHPEGPITIHRVTADWTELEATWNSLNGSFESGALATIPAQAEGGVWMPVNITAQVQAWVNGAPNYGILLRTESEGVHARYSAKEDGAHAPRLDVTYGAAAVSSLNIRATGMLAGGVIRTLGRTDARTYQPPSSFAPPILKDTYVDRSSRNTNYGTDPVLKVGDAGAARYALIDLGLAPVAAGARIVSAELSLHLESVTAAPAGATITVHRMLEHWTESGATHNKSNGTRNWEWPENHDTSSVNVSVPFESPAPGWISLDIRPLLAAWASNTGPNFGLVLAGANGLNNARFTSSDGADAAFHPKLTVSYACGCTTVCLPPQGSGAVLLVVVDDNNMTPHERAIRAAIRSWGYTVTTIKSSANQGQFNTQAESHDAIFVVDTAAIQARDKLKDMTIGVVSMQGNINSTLKLAQGWNTSIGSSLNILDTSHEITQPFSGGAVDIYRANMEGRSVSGAEAPDLQTLGDWNGAGGLAVLERGARSTNGVSPGRRVLLPLGRNQASDFDWNFLNQNGLLLVQRSIEWAMGPKVPQGAKSVLMVVGNDTNLTDQEIAKLIVIESWGMATNVIDEDDSQASFAAAFAEADVVFVTEEARANDIGNKLTAATIGVVTEEADLSDELGFSDDVQWERNETELQIDNSHYVTLPLASGLQTVLTHNEDLAQLKGDIAPDMQILGESDGKPALAVLEQDAETIDGNAAGRRVFLPWGDDKMDFEHLNANGLTILQRALEWGADTAGATTSAYFLSTDSPATLGGLDFTDRDIAEYAAWTDTANLFFDGGLTTLSKEIDALHVLANGHLLVSTKGDTTLGGVSMKDGDLVDYDVVNDIATMVFDGSDLFGDPNEKLISVHLLDNGHFILSTDGDASLGGLNFKEEDLVEYDPATDTATLFFDGSATTMTKEIAAVQILSDGHIVLAPKGKTTLGGLSIKEGDLVDYDPASDTAELVFSGAELFTDPKEKIMSVHIGPGTGSLECEGTFRDEFNAISFGGSEGTLDWSGDWLELGESNGANAGDLRVRAGLNDFSLQARDNDHGGNGVERSANLFGAASATLSYQYRRDDLTGADDYAAVSISANGAAGPWTELVRYQGPANDGAYLAANHDISAHISPNTRIRFRTAPTMGQFDTVWFDDIEIQCDP